MWKENQGITFASVLIAAKFATSPEARCDFCSVDEQWLAMMTAFIISFVVLFGILYVIKHIIKVASNKQS